MKSMLASMTIVLTFCAAPAASAEFPKTGEAEYDTYYVDNTVAKIDSGAGAGAIVDITGITRNVKGEGPFHDISSDNLDRIFFNLEAQNPISGDELTAVALQGPF